MRLELVNQLLDCFLAGVIMLLDGRMRQSLHPEVNFTATTVVVRSTALLDWSKDVLASELVVSWRPIMQVRFKYSFFKVKWEIDTFCCTILLLTF